MSLLDRFSALNAKPEMYNAEFKPLTHEKFDTTAAFDTLNKAEEGLNGLYAGLKVPDVHTVDFAAEQAKYNRDKTQLEAVYNDPNMKIMDKYHLGKRVQNQSINDPESNIRVKSNIEAKAAKDFTLKRTDIPTESKDFNIAVNEDRYKRTGGSTSLDPNTGLPRTYNNIVTNRSSKVDGLSRSEKVNFATSGDMGSDKRGLELLNNLAAITTVNTKNYGVVDKIVRDLFTDDWNNNGGGVLESTKDDLKETLSKKAVEEAVKNGKYLSVSYAYDNIENTPEFQKELEKAKKTYIENGVRMKVHSLTGKQIQTQILPTPSGSSDEDENKLFEVQKGVVSANAKGGESFENLVAREHELKYNKEKSILDKTITAEDIRLNKLAFKTPAYAAYEKKLYSLGEKYNTGPDLQGLKNKTQQWFKGVNIDNLPKEQKEQIELYVEAHTPGYKSLSPKQKGAAITKAWKEGIYTTDLQVYETKLGKGTPVQEAVSDGIFGKTPSAKEKPQFAQGINSSFYVNEELMSGGDFQQLNSEGTRPTVTGRQTISPFTRSPFGTTHISYTDTDGQRQIAYMQRDDSDISKIETSHNINGKPYKFNAQRVNTIYRTFTNPTGEGIDEIKVGGMEIPVEFKRVGKDKLKFTINGKEETVQVPKDLGYKENAKDLSVLANDKILKILGI